MKVLACEYNMDTNTVDLVFNEDLSLSIYCDAIERLYDVSIPQQSDLDYLIYNHPLEYAEFVMSGRLQNFLGLPSINQLEG